MFDMKLVCPENVGWVKQEDKGVIDSQGNKTPGS